MEKETGIDERRVDEVLDALEKEEIDTEFVKDGLAEIEHYQPELFDYQEELLSNGSMKVPDKFNLARVYCFRMVPLKWKTEPLTSAEVADSHEFLFGENYSLKYFARAINIIGQLSDPFSSWFYQQSSSILDQRERAEFIIGGLTTVLGFHMKELKKRGVDLNSFKIETTDFDGK